MKPTGLTQTYFYLGSWTTDKFAAWGIANSVVSYSVNSLTFNEIYKWLAYETN